MKSQKRGLLVGKGLRWKGETLWKSKKSERKREQPETMGIYLVASPGSEPRARTVCL